LAVIEEKLEVGEALAYSSGFGEATNSLGEKRPDLSQFIIAMQALPERSLCPPPIPLPTIERGSKLHSPQPSRGSAGISFRLFISLPSKFHVGFLGNIPKLKDF
jgi:hypothetical protein